MAAAGSMPRPSDIIAGSYRVERTIGMGGMGHVVAATDLRTNAPVAIKLLSVKDDEIAVQRFFREARASMNIRCDHVVRVLEVGSVHGAQPFMVMERLTGQDLAQRVRGQKVLPVQEVVDIAVDTCDALGHAHAAGIVHRDIKLSNLFFCEPDSIIKVLDFGISKSEDREVWERTLTRTGVDSVLGSPPFMSPEQIRTPKTVDGRTDIWALGVVLYRLLSGRMPFDGDTVGELFATILERDPMPLTTLAPHVSPAISAVVHKCLLRDRQQRYANVGQIAHDLKPFATHKAAADSAMFVQPPGMELENVGTMSLDGPMPAPPPNSSGSKLPFGQPPPRGSLPSAPQIGEVSRASYPPQQYPSQQYPSHQPYASQPPFPGPPSSNSAVSALGMHSQSQPPPQVQTGPQPLWSGSGSYSVPDVVTGPTNTNTLAGNPRIWPWIAVSFAALGLAIVLAWGASSPSQGSQTAPRASASSTSAAPQASTAPLVTGAPAVSVTPSASAPVASAAPQGGGQGQGTKKKPPPAASTAKPAGGGLHDNPYAQPQ